MRKTILMVFFTTLLISPQVYAEILEEKQELSDIDLHSQEEKNDLDLTPLQKSNAAEESVESKEASQESRVRQDFALETDLDVLEAEAVTSIYVVGPTFQAVKNALLYFPALNQRFQTNSEGSVEIEIPFGTYDVEITAKGYESRKESVILDESSLVTGVEFSLDLPIDEVVVTGTRTEKFLERAPVKTQVINREAIERKKAETLADALETSSGVRVENNCQNCNFTQVRLNGLEGRYSQILIDGKSVISSLAGVYGLEQIPEEMIDRIEIVKGGGSALYGASAVAGVINVISSKPRKNFANFGSRFALTGMKEPQFKASADAGMVNSARNFAMHVFGAVGSRAPWDADGDGFSEMGMLREVVAGAESYFDLPHDIGIELKFHGLQEKRRGGDNIDAPEHDVAIAESTTARRFGGEVRFKQLINSHINYNLSYALAYTERDSYYGGGGELKFPELINTPQEPSEEDYKNDPAGYEAAMKKYHEDMGKSIINDPSFGDISYDQWVAKMTALGSYGRTTNWLHTADAIMNVAFNALGEQIVTAGLQFQYENLKDSFPAYDRKIDDSYWDLGVIIQHNWSFADWGESLLGLRIDKHNKLNDPVLSPRAALIFRPTSFLKTRTSFSSGFRAPEIFDEDLHVTIVGGEGTIIRNHKDLKPEYSYSLAQQVEADFDFADNWEFVVSVNGFWTRIMDAFNVESDPTRHVVGENSMIRINRGSTTVAGVEFESRVQFANTWGLDLAWSYEYARNSEADGDFEEIDKKHAKYIFRTPALYGYVSTWLSILNGLEINTALNITGPMYVPHKAGMPEAKLKKSPWFADWSANLSYTFKLADERYIRLYAGMKNILNSYQRDLEKGAERDAGYVYGPRIPRTFFVGIKGGI